MSSEASYLAAEAEQIRPRWRVSTAAALAGMHPQTLRQYDRLGLVVPARSRGGGRRYSKRDVERLAEIQRLSQEEGVNLAGISRIMELTRQLDQLRREVSRLNLKLLSSDRVFAASPSGEVTALGRGQRTRPHPHNAAGEVVKVRGHRAELVVWRA